jgi:hypothetical protein
MATPWRESYITLGGLMMGSLGIEATDFDDVFTDPRKRGEPRPIPQVAGRAARDMTGDAVLAAIEVQVRGDYTQDNVPVSGASRLEEFYDHLADLRAVTRNGTVQTLDVVLYAGATISGIDVQIADGGRLIRDVDYAGKVVVSVFMLDGAIDLAAELAES